MDLYQIRVILLIMGLTYFKRFRMEYDLNDLSPDRLGRGISLSPTHYELVPFSMDLLQEHAEAKYESFRFELDANVFPCLGEREGCLRLMREIATRASFLPEATWLCRYRDAKTGVSEPVGTIQGIAVDGWGAIQNVGVDPLHRNRGLGSLLLAKAAAGFIQVGIERMHLEVTTENVGALRVYERLGFTRTETVYKAAEVAGA